MSSFPSQLLFIFSILLGLSTFISCDNVIFDEKIETINSKSFDQPNQASLVKLGFSGILWNHIKSNRNQLNNLSPQCLIKLKHASDLIESDDPEALKLLSASSHLPNKMFEISYTDFEGYYQCLSLKSTHYCQASVLPNQRNIYPHWFSLKYNTTIHIGFCLPRECSSNDVDNLITKVVQSYDWEKIYFHGCHIPSNLIERLTKANAPQLGSFFFLCGILFIVCISSIMDYFGIICRVNGLNWLRHFALQKTHRNVIDSLMQDRINIIDYFRIVISVIFQLVHSFALIAISNLLYTVESLSTARNFITQWTYQPFNSDWIYGGLIYLGASVVATQLWATIKPDTRFSTYVGMFIKRLFMYWPILIVVIAIKIVLPLLGTGPVYTYHTQWRSDVCAANWWYTLLHIHNYQNAYDMCYGPFWSMDAELHLFAVALIFVFLYKTRPRMAYIINLITMIIGLAIVFNIYYSNKFVYRLAGYKFEHWEQIENFVTSTYLPSESHLFTYSLGLMVTFHCCMSPSRSLGMPKKISQLISLVLTISVIMAAYSPGLFNVLQIETTPFWYAIHATLCKAVVSFGFAWIAWLGAHNETVYKILSKSKGTLDSNQNTIESKSTPKEKLNQSPSIGYKMLYAASRATYFSHWPFYVWFYSHKTKVYLDFRFFADLIFLIFTGFFSGLTFHYLVLGPFESIVASFRLRKFGKFD